MRYKGNFSSNAGSVLYSAQEAVHRYDPATGEKTELFQWADVALSYEEMGDRLVFENAKGDFFYPTSKDLIKVTRQQVPVKQVLTLACFSDDSEETAAKYMGTANLYTDELMDAIVRFNNTDPEYKVEIKPVHFKSEAERDRLLIEIATGKDIDLIDTSILPENAIKDGLLVDMLPYIDADTEISREDFIEPLFSAMLKKGGLYEYTDKFTMLTLIARKDQFSGREAWTVDSIRALMAQNELDCPSREYLLEPFIMAATAEFIDWDTMSCSFDSPAFQSWLSFLKERPEHIEHYENPFLFLDSTDYAGEAGHWARNRIEADYAVSGFPNTSGTGSYFVKLNGPFNMDAPTLGSNTRLGILASGAHPDGAWRFVKTLMLSGDGERVSKGIPVFKQRFEKSLEAEMAKKHDVGPGVVVFGESDAQILREQVYNTTKLVHHDEVLLQLIRSESAPYFAGQKTLEETVQQIQTRVGIYLAEQQ